MNRASPDKNIFCSFKLGNLLLTSTGEDFNSLQCTKRICEVFCKLDLTELKKSFVLRYSQYKDVELKTLQLDDVQHEISYFQKIFRAYYGT